ncbi:hypothetical protein DPMN_169562 [Dreissena polymorpha]|uniref:Uncharacterized protein n=1 Tax=Dreissena polymorpha TaxID=45954 RepID=A0A9D4IC39_DREPO|nr:hypothetical protein DPMN_169562 [Dreissena polymorpha]
MREMLRTSFAEQPSSCCEVCGLAVLSNDEKTRSFLTLTVSCADDVLESYTSAVDKCFKEYNLPLTTSLHCFTSALVGVWEM